MNTNANCTIVTRNSVIRVIAIVAFVTFCGGTEVPARGFFFNFFHFHHYRRYHKLFVPHYRIVTHYVIEKYEVPALSKSDKTETSDDLDKERHDRLREIKDNLEKLNEDLKAKALEELLRLHQNAK